jgi:hypothetical protein
LVFLGIVHRHLVAGICKDLNKWSAKPLLGENPFTAIPPNKDSALRNEGMPADYKSAAL